MQSNPELSNVGIPINNEARTEKAKADIKGMSFNPKTNQEENQGEALTESQQIALDRYTKTMDELSEELNYYPIQDDTINDMVDNEVAHYFDGSKSAEEVAKTLQKKLELYFK